MKNIYYATSPLKTKINKEIRYYELLLAGVLGSSTLKGAKECLDYCLKIRALRSKLI
jgi:hypothetical protein